MPGPAVLDGVVQVGCLPGVPVPDLLRDAEPGQVVPVPSRVGLAHRRGGDRAAQFDRLVQVGQVAGFLVTGPQRGAQVGLQRQGGRVAGRPPADRLPDQADALGQPASVRAGRQHQADPEVAQAAGPVASVVRRRHGQRGAGQFGRLGQVGLVAHVLEAVTQHGGEREARGVPVRRFARAGQHGPAVLDGPGQAGRVAADPVVLGPSVGRGQPPLGRLVRVGRRAGWIFQRVDQLAQAGRVRGGRGPPGQAHDQQHPRRAGLLARPGLLAGPPGRGHRLVQQRPVPGTRRLLDQGPAEVALQPEGVGMRGRRQPHRLPVQVHRFGQVPPGLLRRAAGAGQHRPQGQRAAQVGAQPGLVGIARGRDADHLAAQPHRGLDVGQRRRVRAGAVRGHPELGPVFQVGGVFGQPARPQLSRRAGPERQLAHLLADQDGRVQVGQPVAPVVPRAQPLPQIVRPRHEVLGAEPPAGQRGGPRRDRLVEHRALAGQLEVPPQRGAQVA